MEKAKEQPRWLQKFGKVNEVIFCEEFLLNHPMICDEGVFFTPEGRMSDEEPLRREIYNLLRPWLASGLGARVDSIIQTLTLECCRQSPDRDEASTLYTVDVANGNYSLLHGFSPMKHITRHRLPVNYNPEAPEPERWIAFLNDLLEPEDIVTLQEYMGYCLIPTTLGQKMLIIVGQGGEGKSRIGVVMKELLGDNMSLNSLAKIENSPFARADIQHMLLMVDDDLKMEALNQTNYIKSIVTAELPMDLERKGIQSYQGKLHCRFMAFGNDSLQALHDRSHGFFRRQIILQAKPRPVGRKDDVYLGFSLRQEKEGILLWCLEGLKRLHLQDFQFTLSRQAKKNLMDAMIRGNNLLEFMSSSGYIRLDAEGSASSRQLYAIYRDWCEDNVLKPVAEQSFWTFLSQQGHRYGLRPSKHIPAGNGKQVRGFKGIRGLPR